MAAVVSEASTDLGDEDSSYTLHQMFRVVGDQMTPRDVKVLKFLYTGFLKDDIKARIHSGYDFLLALERLGRCDYTNFKHIVHLLKIITRHDLMPFVTLRKRKIVKSDPVDVYLEETASCSTLSSHKRAHASSQLVPSLSNDLSHTSAKTHRHSKRMCTRSASRLSKRQTHSQTQAEDIRKKNTCDVRLRVRAEYCYHDNALNGNIFSNKPDLVERQFEKFMQANTILLSRDLGAITCDIKFSELTYLDAFWRDYVNGSLLEALKGVFITESLKQAVGYQAIKLLVNVDEDDYERGRLKLLQNLRD